VVGSRTYGVQHHGGLGYLTGKVHRPYYQQENKERDDSYPTCTGRAVLVPPASVGMNADGSIAEMSFDHCDALWSSRFR